MMQGEQAAQCTTSCKLLSRFCLLVACRRQRHPVGDTSCNPPNGQPRGRWAQTHPTRSASSTGAAQSIDCTSQTANKSPSELGSKPDSQVDLFLPASGLPPIPGHLVQAITDCKFVEFGDLLPEALQEAQFDRVSDKKDDSRQKRSTQSLHQWAGWRPSPLLWQ